MAHGPGLTRNQSHSATSAAPPGSALSGPVAKSPTVDPIHLPAVAWNGAPSGANP